MTIGAANANPYGYNYNSYAAGYGTSVSGYSQAAAGAVEAGQAAGSVQAGQPAGSVQEGQKAQPTDKEHTVKRGYKSSPAECQTCKERKYQDGSNESDVSFKAPGHISPQASASVVMAHEQQHVSNAYQRASEKNGKVVSSSVSLRTAICPECGTSYVSGGTTSTTISYPNESNPYQKEKRAQDAIRLTGANVDYAA